jgi:hypothetical protein
MGGRLNLMATQNRDHLETAMTAHVDALLAIDETLLRIRQALRRSNQVKDVLEPAVERMMEIRRELVLAQQEVRQAWQAEQEKKWK